MDDLSAVTESVVKALGGFDDVGNKWRLQTSSGYIMKDGSNVFDPYWRCRCLDWLLDRGTVSMGSVSIFFDDEDESGNGVGFGCPAAEFPARAVHHLISAAARPARS